MKNKLYTYMSVVFFLTIGTCLYGKEIMPNGDVMIRYETSGSERYYDGSIVADNECYGIVATKQGMPFEGFTTNGELVNTSNSTLVAAFSVSKNGRVKNTIVAISSDFWKKINTGVLTFILFDTRDENGIPTSNISGIPSKIRGYTIVFNTKYDEDQCQSVGWTMFDHRKVKTYEDYLNEQLLAEKTTVTNKNAEIYALLDNLEEEREKYNALVDKAHGLTSRVEELEKANFEMYDELTNQYANVDILTNEVFVLTSSNSLISAEKDLLAKLTDAYEDDIGKLLTRNEELDSLIKKIQNRILALEKENSILADLNQQWNRNYNSLTSENSGLVEKNNELEKEIAELSKDVDEFMSINDIKIPSVTFKKTMKYYGATLVNGKATGYIVSTVGKPSSKKVKISFSVVDSKKTYSFSTTGNLTKNGACEGKVTKKLGSKKYTVEYAFGENRMYVHIYGDKTNMTCIGCLSSSYMKYAIRNSKTTAVIR